MTTLREHLEAIRDLADAEPPRTHDIYRRANEAIAILDSADTRGIDGHPLSQRFRLVADPKQVSA